MIYDVIKVSADRWAELATEAHLAVFEERLFPGYDRIDFALLVVERAPNQPVAYLTARELDADSVYLKHGGAFPPVKGTIYSLPIYRQMINYVTERYKRITTLVENTNTVYLKMALTCGFKVIGMRYFKKTILLELFLGDETAP